MGSVAITRSYHLNLLNDIPGLTVKDVQELSPKFWDMHSDPIAWNDGATMTILTIHINLAVGTISSYLKERPDLQPLVDDLLAFRAV